MNYIMFKHLRTCQGRLKQLEKEREKLYQSPRENHIIIETYKQDIEWCKKEIERAKNYVDKMYLYKIEPVEYKVTMQYYFYGDDWPEAVSRGAAEKISESILDNDDEFEHYYQAWKKKINRHLKKVTYVPAGHE